MKKKVTRRSKSMLYILVATYKQNHNKGLPRLLNSLRIQSNKDFKVIVCHDGPDEDGTEDLCSKAKKDWGLDITFLNTPTREDCWGHNTRKYALNYIIKGLRPIDYIHFTNGDNVYSKDAVRWFYSGLIEGNPTAVLCQIRHSYFNFKVLPVQFKEAYCDFMNMFIRADIMQQIGFPFRNFAADAHLIKTINSMFKADLWTYVVQQIIGAHC